VTAATLAVCGLSSPALAEPGGIPPGAPPDIVADPAVLRATLVCDPPAAPGRLRCDVEARGHKGALRWVDVQIVGAAGFIAPLRGRAGPREAATREDDLWRWSLGLYARDHGVGDVTVRVRAIVCEGEECSPEVALAVAHVTVP
jgi:hypothetical protein